MKGKTTINGNIYNKPSFSGLKDTCKQKIHNITHAAEIDSKKPNQIFVCKHYDPATKQIKDSTLSKDAINKMPEFVRNLIYGLALMYAVGVPIKIHSMAQ